MYPNRTGRLHCQLLLVLTTSGSSTIQLFASVALLHLSPCTIPGWIRHRAIVGPPALTICAPISHHPSCLLACSPTLFACQRCCRTHCVPTAVSWCLQVYLISTKAGSVGINLTAAFRMIIYDELWNPVHNAQVRQHTKSLQCCVHRSALLCLSQVWKHKDCLLRSTCCVCKNKRPVGVQWRSAGCQ